jgi:hypothetical protein
LNFYRRTEEEAFMATREDIRAFIRDNPNQMTMLLAKKFDVPEVEIVRAFPENRVVEVDPVSDTLTKTHPSSSGVIDNSDVAEVPEKSFPRFARKKREKRELALTGLDNE